jgi:hypothetical protein
MIASFDCKFKTNQKKLKGSFSILDLERFKAHYMKENLKIMNMKCLEKY